jgi:hypothetical protein
MMDSVQWLATAAILLLASGCATNGTGKPAGDSAAAGQAIPSSVAKQAHLSGADIVALQHAGYKIVNQNGQTMYCNTDPRTGSRIAKDNICMTEQEMVALREETQRRLQNMTMQVPPPHGN